MEKSKVNFMRNGVFVIFICSTFLVFSMIDTTFLGQSRQVIAQAEDGMIPALHVQQPNPFSADSGEHIVIIDHEGQERIVGQQGSQRGQNVTAKGKVIMTRGDVITVQIDEKDWPVEFGDAVKVSYSVDGEVIPVGTWRVSAVKEDGTVEAVPFEIKGKPNIGMDAVLSLSDRSGRPQALKKPGPSAEEKGSITDQKMTQTGHEGTSVQKDAQPKSLEETLASYSRTAVPISIAGSGKSLPCEIGAIRIHDGKIEMTASGQGKFTGYCMYRLSDVALENFYATVKVSVNTASNKDFSAAVIYGDQSGDTKKSGYVRADILQMSSKSCSGLFGLFDCRTYFMARVSVSGIFTKGEGYSVKNGILPDSGSNPTPGILAFLKNGDHCRVFWNGEEMGGWKEQAMANGYLWLAFVPMGNGEATATFEDISIYRLHERQTNK